MTFCKHIHHCFLTKLLPTMFSSLPANGLADFWFAIMNESALKCALSKRRYENMQQVYRRRSMPKCDFTKVAFSFIEIILRHECSPVIMLHIFRTSFLKNISGGLLLNVWSVEHSLFIVVKLLRFKWKRWRIFLKYLLLIHFPAGNYMFKVNNRNTRTS